MSIPRNSFSRDIKPTPVHGSEIPSYFDKDGKRIEIPINSKIKKVRDKHFDLSKSRERFNRHFFRSNTVHFYVKDQSGNSFRVSVKVSKIREKLSNNGNTRNLDSDLRKNPENIYNYLNPSASRIVEEKTDSQNSAMSSEAPSVTEAEPLPAETVEDLEKSVISEQEYKNIKEWYENNKSQLEENTEITEFSQSGLRAVFVPEGQNKGLYISGDDFSGDMFHVDKETVSPRKEINLMKCGISEEQYEKIEVWYKENRNTFGGSDPQLLLNVETGLDFDVIYNPKEPNKGLHIISNKETETDEHTDTLMFHFDSGNTSFYRSPKNPQI